MTQETTNYTGNCTLKYLKNKYNGAARQSRLLITWCTGAKPTRLCAFLCLALLQPLKFVLVKTNLTFWSIRRNTLQLNERCSFLPRQFDQFMCSCQLGDSKRQTTLMLENFQSDSMVYIDHGYRVHVVTAFKFT